MKTWPKSQEDRHLITEQNYLPKNKEFIPKYLHQNKAKNNSTQSVKNNPISKTISKKQ